MRLHGVGSAARDAGRSTADLYQRVFGAPSESARSVPRPPRWWAPSALNHAMHRLGYPLGEVVARGTASLRRRLGSADLMPRAIVRVDDYPHWTVSSDRFWEFHAVLADHGVRYLLGATPFLLSDPLSGSSGAPRPFVEREWARLVEALGRGELEVGLHGVTHRARTGAVASEFDSSSPEEAERSIADAWRWLVLRGMTPVAFIPPFNRFPMRLWSALPVRCNILCLGPESLRDVPLLWSPAAYCGRTVVYSLRPFYGRATEILRGLRKGRWLEIEGSIIPITLHWTWEMSDGFRAVSALARYLAGFVKDWSSFAAAQP